jgi:branched-chain amino acid transport system ATP-binding protein/neutral amino acid transport system ATP-binding protein
MHVVFDRIAEIAESGTAILLVEQNARMSLSLSSRAYVMAMGRNELEGDARSLLENEEIGRVYLGR